MADSTLTIVLGFVTTMSGLIGAGIWRIYVYRDTKKQEAIEQAGDRLRKRKNLEIRTKNQLIEQQANQVTEQMATIAYLRAQLDECLKRQTG